MKEIAISVTEAARNFAECMNRVRYQGASFLLKKNGLPVARIVPVAPEPDQAEQTRLVDSKRSAPEGCEETGALKQQHRESNFADAKAKLPALNW